MLKLIYVSELSEQDCRAAVYDVGTHGYNFKNIKPASTLVFNFHHKDDGVLLGQLKLQTWVEAVQGLSVLWWEEHNAP